MKKSIVIVVAPSGAGKTTFLERLMVDLPGRLGDTITFTSRKPRVGESEGHPYHFVTPERFEELIQKNYFVEWARVHDQYYGTPAHQIEDIWAQGQGVIMDVDIQGCKTFKSKFPQAKSIFIHPPSIDALRQRLCNRTGGPPKDMDLRLANAEKEMARSAECDYQIVNDDFELSYARFKKLVEEILQQD